jgi:hypothetical protein
MEKIGPHNQDRTLQERMREHWESVLHPSIATQVEYFSYPRQKFSIENIEDDQLFLVATAAGSLAAYRESGEDHYAVRYSDLEGLEDGDFMQLNGASLGGSLALTNVIGQGCCLSYSKLVRTDLTPNDIKAIGPETYSSGRVSGFIKSDPDGEEYIRHWDTLYRHTPAVKQLFLSQNGNFEPVFSEI